MLGRLLSGRLAARATADPARRGRDRALIRAAAAMGLALLLLLGVLAFEAERAPSGPPAAAPAAVAAVPRGAVPPPSLPMAAVINAPTLETAVVAPAVVAPVARPAVEAPPAAAAMPSPPAVPLGDGYLIQLGVFGAQANAESLRAELAARGLPAHIESRVVLGPFSSREAAEAAQARLRRDRQAEGLIVPPRKPK